MNGNGTPRKLEALLKQRKIGIFVGMTKIVVSNISPYAGWVSLVLLVITSFYTTISPLFQEWKIFFPFWLFCLIMIVVLVIMAIVEWVFMMPSYYKANNLQAWDAGGPLQDKVNRMEEDIKEIRKLLEIKKENNDKLLK